MKVKSNKVKRIQEYLSLVESVDLSGEPMEDGVPDDYMTRVEPARVDNFNDYGDLVEAFETIEGNISITQTAMEVAHHFLSWAQQKNVTLQKITAKILTVRKTDVHLRFFSVPAVSTSIVKDFTLSQEVPQGLLSGMILGMVNFLAVNPEGSEYLEKYHDVG